MKSTYKIALTVLLVSCFILASGFNKPSRQQFTPYTQAIPGSELSINLVPIKGGKFLMGSHDSEPGRNTDEGPQNEVLVSDFWMSTLEITWDQFELFLYREIDNDINTSNREIELQVDGIAGATMPYVNFNKPGYPLINVTNYAASTFCKWLSAKTGHFYRLPTEAEWELACRAGSNQPYPFDTAALDDHAWYAGNSKDAPNKGGKKKPNALGLYDMHGNVAEWVIDAYGAEFYGNLSDLQDPLNYPETLYPRVVRGGSFKDAPQQLRSASRQFSDKSWKKRDPQIPKSLWWLTDAQHIGFRIVRPKVVPPESEWAKYWGKPMKEY